MQTADFHFELPVELIAQQPAAHRDDSRLLILDRLLDKLTHRQFSDLLEYLRPGDVLVLNNSRVIPARLRGVNVKTGGQFELLLLEENATNDWWAMMKPGKRARIGTQVQLGSLNAKRGNILATVTDTNAEGHRRLQFSNTADIANELEALGEIPLPPYIRRAPQAGGTTRVPNSENTNDIIRYQTIYADPPGSVAAPTAGLHFTSGLLEKIRTLGVHVCFVTLHVGLGTFAPVKAESLVGHVMHEERFEISGATAQIVNAAKREGRRVIAVGTTSVRVLESAVLTTSAPVSEPAKFTTVAGSGRTRIFIYPPYEFKAVDALVTNFHLPCSTLLMLVSAFAAPGELRGRERILSAYAEAIRNRYRFFSYGDAMFDLMKQPVVRNLATVRRRAPGLSRAVRNSSLPFVLVNMAMTADGKIATVNRAVSSFGSRRDHEHLLELRATADAVMSGARTVDSAKVNMGPGGAKFRRLRLRRGLTEYNLRVIVTGGGSIDPQAEVFKHGFSPIIILTTKRARVSARRRLQQLANEVKVCGEDEINLRSALRWLRTKWGVKRLLCEGGGALNDALFRAGLVNELHLTVCPKIFGGRSAPTIAEGRGFAKLAHASQFELKSAQRSGEELFLVFTRVSRTSANLATSR